MRLGSCPSRVTVKELLSIAKLAAWETEYEHWTSSVVRTGR